MVTDYPVKPHSRKGTENSINSTLCVLVSLWSKPQRRAGGSGTAPASDRCLARKGMASAMPPRPPPRPQPSPQGRGCPSGDGRGRGLFLRLGLSHPAHGSRRGPHPFAPPGLRCGTGEGAPHAATGCKFPSWLRTGSRGGSWRRLIRPRINRALFCSAAL